MAENKLQHFVPRCHLKPFSAGEEGKSIALLRVQSDAVVKVAPVKGQCARNYFYGEDLQMEKALQGIEGLYAAAIATLTANPSALKSSHFELFRAFAYLQHRRTEQAALRLAAFNAGLADIVFQADENQKSQIALNTKAAVNAGFAIWNDTKTYVDDLNCCILVNVTGEPFITSDDPVVLVNRFYHQRLRREDYGIANSGLCLFMPLTPRHALLCWDSFVYSVQSSKNGFVELPKLGDVRAINSLQLQRAANAVYFSPPEFGEMLIEQLRVVKKAAFQAPRPRSKLL